MTFTPFTKLISPIETLLKLHALGFWFSFLDSTSSSGKILLYVYSSLLIVIPTYLWSSNPQGKARTVNDRITLDSSLELKMNDNDAPPLPFKSLTYVIPLSSSVAMLSSFPSLVLRSTKLDSASIEVFLHSHFSLQTIFVQSLSKHFPHNGHLLSQAWLTSLISILPNKEILSRSGHWGYAPSLT